jgi:hypothetical protein
MRGIAGWAHHHGSLFPSLNVFVETCDPIPRQKFMRCVGELRYCIVKYAANTTDNQ